jgi:hypothetical protein
MIFNPYHILLRKMERGGACGKGRGGQKVIRDFGGETRGKETTLKTKS